MKENLFPPFYVFRFVRCQYRENFHGHYPNSEHSCLMIQWQVHTGMHVYNDVIPLIIAYVKIRSVYHTEV